jgi:hypothetical protein
MARDIKSKRYTWRGPAPDDESDAYLLAMILRTYDSLKKGAEFEPQPSTITDGNALAIATAMFIFKKQSMDTLKRAASIPEMDSEGLSFKAYTNKQMDSIKRKYKKDIAALAKQLLKYKCTPRRRGFICYGG